MAQLVDRTALADSGLPRQAMQAASTPMANIVSTATGSNNAMALTEDGEIWSWGRNDSNVLGYTSPTQNLSTTPSKVRNPANTASLTGIVQIGVGDWNASALADDGSVYSWGWGKTVGQGTSATGAFANKVQLLGGGFLSDIVQISVGRNFTLALSRSGAVYAWGYDTELSTGTASSVDAAQVAYATPVVTAGALTPLTGIVSVSAGYANGMALTATGNVYVWGRNSSGQLAQGTQTYNGSLAVLAKAPVGQAGNLGNIKAVSAGGNHLLALTANGEVLSWGFSGNGQLGQGETVSVGNQSTLPLYVIDPSGGGPLTGVKAIAASYYNSTALLSSGEVLIWGANYASALGQDIPSGTLFSSRVPLKVKDATGAKTLNVGSLAEFKNLHRQFP
jgi:alpha-tubulin suppressor-like RCC1 family protein